MTEDLVGVRQVPVYAIPKTPEIRQKVMARLRVMQREVNSVQMAIGSLMGLLAMPDPPSKPVADRVVDLRNWSISVAMSHTYVQSMLSSRLSSTYMLFGYEMPALSRGDDVLPELFLRGVLVAMKSVKGDFDFDSERGERNGPERSPPRVFGVDITKI